MAKLSFIQRVISPAKNSGAKKNLLKRDGITSDGACEDDDGSSSLSERQEKNRSKSKKKFSTRNLFRRMGTKSSSGEDGYESDTSDGSTRSTSSSFLRFQNRGIWKSKLTKKSVFQRREDGSEAPMQDETRPWPMFDKIYKRQNVKVDNGEDGEGGFSDDDDDDSISSTESVGECPLAPPAPAFAVGIEEEESVDEIEERNQGKSNGLEGSPKSFHEGESQKQGVLGVLQSLVGGGSSEGASEKASGESQEESDHFVKSTPEKSLQGSPKSYPESSSSDSSPMAVQEGGIQATAEEESTGHPSVERSPKDSIEVPLTSEPASVQQSGIPTSEAPKEKTASSSASPPQARSVSSPRDAPQQDASLSPQVFPTQKLTPSSHVNITPKGKKSKSPRAKPPKSSRQKKNVSVDVTPVSIPRTICYSLRSAIGDGSARQRNSHSLMERRPLRPNGCAVDTSYWSHRGNRAYMEDRFVIEHMGSTSKDAGDKKPISLLAVFDGHGGSYASQFCSDWLSSYIRKNNDGHFPNNLPMAMKTAFTKIDSDFVSSGNFDGTTACACTIVGKKIVCCNTGDSRAIIVRRDGSAVALSEDHKPDRNDETKRINDLGGRVIHWGRWRVEGVLAVSRSIGDARLKPYVTAEPDIVEHEIGEDDMFLVVASDGVWDTMSNDLVAKFVLVNTCKIVDKGLNVDKRLLRWIARQVSKRARENGSSDNISCIVANLRA